MKNHFLKRGLLKAIFSAAIISATSQCTTLLTISGHLSNCDTIDDSKDAYRHHTKALLDKIPYAKSVLENARKRDTISCDVNLKPNDDSFGAIYIPFMDTILISLHKNEVSRDEFASIQFHEYFHAWQIYFANNVKKSGHKAIVTNEEKFIYVEATAHVAQVRFLLEGEIIGVIKQDKFSGTTNGMFNAIKREYYSYPDNIPHDDRMNMASMTVFKSLLEGDENWAIRFREDYSTEFARQESNPKGLKEIDKNELLALTSLPNGYSLMQSFIDQHGRRPEIPANSYSNQNFRKNRI